MSLNDGERDFVLDLRTFYDENKDFFKDRELYLLRNMSKAGHRLLRGRQLLPRLHPLAAGRQEAVRHLRRPEGPAQLDEGSSNPKIQFYQTIKEIEARLADPIVILNSFIVSTTPVPGRPMWGEGMTKAELEKCHVLFQKDDPDYVQRLFGAIQ